MGGELTEDPQNGIPFVLTHSQMDVAQSEKALGYAGVLVPVSI